MILHRHHSHPHHSQSRPLVRLWVASLAAALAFGIAPAAGAAPAVADTTCEGTIVGERIVGDVVVPAGAFCTIERSVILGDLHAEPEGNVTASSSTIKGDVLVAGDWGFVTFRESTVFGGISFTGQRARLTLIDSTVRHSIRGSADYVELWRASVEGNITIDTDDYNVIGESTVLGWVTVRHGGLTVEWSSIGKGLTSHLTAGVNVCGSDIDGDVTISHATRVVGIGTNPDGLGECFINPPSAGTPRAGLPPAQRDAVTIGGTLTLRDIPHTIFLDNLTVGADLVCSGNSGPRGLNIGSVTVSGARLEQCA